MDNRKRPKSFFFFCWKKFPLTRDDDEKSPRSSIPPFFGHLTMRENLEERVKMPQKSEKI